MKNFSNMTQQEEIRSPSVFLASAPATQSESTMRNFLQTFQRFNEIL